MSRFIYCHLYHVFSKIFTHALMLIWMLSKLFPLYSFHQHWIMKYTISISKMCFLKTAFFMLFGLFLHMNFELSFSNLHNWRTEEPIFWIYKALVIYPFWLLSKFYFSIHLSCSCPLSSNNWLANFARSAKESMAWKTSAPQMSINATTNFRYYFCLLWVWYSPRNNFL